MSKFHSTVSRRSFMKGLGLAGAGLGAASAAAPVFQDLDALAGSKRQTPSVLAQDILGQILLAFTIFTG